MYIYCVYTYTIYTNMSKLYSITKNTSHIRKTDKSSIFFFFEIELKILEVIFTFTWKYKMRRRMATF